MCPSPVASSPRSRPRTPSPSSTILPTNSWPTTSGTDVHIYEWDEWAQRTLSVPQMAVLSTRITTSPAPALGTGTLSSARPGPRWFLTSASMDSTASPSVRRLSCGERPRQLIEACPLAFHLGAQFVQARRHRTEASLPAQVVVERGLVGAGVDAVTLAVEHLVQREEAAGHCEADELDALGGLRLPARRAGRQHEQEAEARHAQSQPDLAQEVVTVSERQRRRVGDAMRGHDRHDVLLGLGLAARGRGRLGAARRGAAALPPGVSVDLVVVADVQDIFVALGGGGERRQADVVGAAVAERN